MSEHEHLFTRDGRLSELSLARFANDELDASERGAVERALAVDADARALLDALREVAIVAAPEQTARPPAPIELARRRTPASALVLALAFAAAAALVVWLLVRPGPPHETAIARTDTSETGDDDGIRTKGDEFAFELWIDDGERNRRVRSGDEVHAGDKLAFRVYPRVAGELLIVCIDPSGVALACWPGEGTALFGPGGFAAVEARGDALTIAPGLAFDAAPGEERFVALLCSDPPPREQVLANPSAAWPSCLSETLHVRKAAAP
jgi:hypothetical protein